MSEEKKNAGAELSDEQLDQAAGGSLGSQSHFICRCCGNYLSVAYLSTIDNVCKSCKERYYDQEAILDPTRRTPGKGPKRL